MRELVSGIEAKRHKESKRQKVNHHHCWDQVNLRERQASPSACSAFGVGHPFTYATESRKASYQSIHTSKNQPGIWHSECLSAPVTLLKAQFWSLPRIKRKLRMGSILSHTLLPEEARRGWWFPGADVTDCGLQTHGCWKLNSGLLQEWGKYHQEFHLKSGRVDGRMGFMSTKNDPLALSC
ncbi:uncharacterized protein LOC143438521 isoform X2 [Arvicanthis niloticus]|uniref:uncharacterized protein LOC143310623 isoform X2 n=1 Tax=Arvicanthis niloticus TaxID=61156 RepID=UPI00402BDCBC